MIFSKLCSYINVSPTSYGARTHKIDTIIIHCFVGQCNVKSGVDCFKPKSKRASCNYVVAKDGQIGGVIPEELASCCTSNKAADERAITIEVACDSFYPYKIYDVVMDSLINLVADICKRNEILELVWSDKKADRVGHKNGVNMGCHRDYANKSCPGQYIYEREGMIAQRVNAILMNKPVVDNNGLGMQSHPVVGSIDFNKLDYSIVFDWKYYRNKYADLSTNGLRTQEDFTKHFKTRGMLEARSGNSLFNPIAYRNHNKDLRYLFGDDWKWYYAHYILAGKKEGRRCL